MSGGRQLRVLVTTTPFLTHLWDVVPLAWALRSRGHDVRVAALPNLTDDVVATSLTAMPVGPLLDWERLIMPDGSTVETLANFARTAAKVAGLLAYGVFEAFDKPGPDRFIPDVVVHEPMDMAGPLIAQRLGVPCVHQSWGPPLAVRARQALDRSGIALRRRFDMAEVVKPPDLVIDVCPPSYHDPSQRIAAPHQSMRYVPYNGPGVVPDWLRDPPDRPRVCLTVGSGPEGVQLMPRIANAIAPLDVEVVVPVRPEYADEVRAAAPHVRQVDWLPLKIMFAAGCDVAIHHGGPGTSLTALGYGVPQLAVLVQSHPSVGDHYINGRLLRNCGAGIWLRDSTMTDADVRDAVQQLMQNSQYKGAASALADEIAAQPTPADAAVAVENLVVRQ
jgi:UDP:flavonoid glycosyltransferase YjiC (YdhE family)